MSCALALMAPPAVASLGPQPSPFAIPSDRGIGAAPRLWWEARLTPPVVGVALFHHPERERLADWRLLWQGRYGPEHWLQAPALSWSSDTCEAAEPTSWVAARALPDSSVTGEVFGNTGLSFLAQQSPRGALLIVEDAGWHDPIHGGGWAAAWLTPTTRATAPCPPWKRPRPVTIARYGGEYERLILLQCDGSISSDTLDRVTVLARPPLTARPRLPLPLEPTAAASADNEWLPQVKLVHPRLIWLLDKIASAFPGRMLYLMSGYRPEAGSRSLHHRGRAVDLFVQGVPNEAVFRFCRTLPQVGCGYYPNNRFVHLDVRPPTVPEAYWVDTSGPSEPSRYVDSWPGVVEGGALRWAGSE